MLFEMTSRESTERFAVTLPSISPTGRAIIKNTYQLRLHIIEFTECIERLGLEEMISLVTNGKGEIHLTDCVWCNDAIKQGSHKCHCYRAISNPDKYFRESYNILPRDEVEKLIKQFAELRKMSTKLPIMNYKLRK
jgi:hypothetical protein